MLKVKRRMLADAMPGLDADADAACIAEQIR